MSNHTLAGKCAAAAAERNALNTGEEPSDTIVLGILMGIAGSVGVNVGQNIQNEKDWSTRSRRLGVAMFVLFAIVNFSAFGFAPASVLAPLEGTQFISNFLWNRIVDKDSLLRKYMPRVGGGTLLVGIGVILPVLGSPGNVADFDEEALKCMWTRTPWLIFLLSAVTLGFACTLAYAQWKQCDWPKNGKEETRRNIQLFYTVPAALLGAFGVANAKVVSELIAILFSGTWEILSWFFVVTIVGIGVGIGCWVLALTYGPGRFPKLTIIPLMNGVYIMLSSIAGGLFFEEFEDFDALGLLLYILGIAILLLGLFLIVPPDVPPDVPLGHSEHVGARDLPTPSSIPHSKADVRDTLNHLFSNTSSGQTDLPTPSSITNSKADVRDTLNHLFSNTSSGQTNESVDVDVRIGAGLMGVLHFRKRHKQVSRSLPIIMLQ